MMTFNSAILIIINCDLISYWQYLHAKIVRLSHQAVLETHENHRRRLEEENHSWTPNGRRLRFPMYEHEASSSYLLCEADFLLENILSEQGSSYDRQIHELHQEIHDFFAQVRTMNGLMNRMLVYVLGAWLVIFPVQSYCLETHLGHRASANAYVYQFALLVVVSGVSQVIWYLHRVCIRSHTILCTLCAHDTSLHKRGFLSIMSYFNEERTCYFIFNSIPFKPSTLLTIVAWSMSGNILLDNLMRYSRTKV